tara:strand:- start:1165 stop:2097 length:933 start_codon:yes stop_codon:yes gene_type:complete
MFKVAALYKFSKIDNPSQVQISLKRFFKDLLIHGTILVGSEGINGTIAAKEEQNLKKALIYLKSLKGFQDLDIKYSYTQKNPFIRLKIKLKQEIVTIGDKSIDPTKSVGEYINPEDWDSFLEQDNILLIDTRNDYEYSIGTFRDSINPETQKFRDFPQWLKNQDFTEKDKKSKKVAMFCTGGIRCEKASSLMKNEGFKKVYHLKGGILKYFESVTKEKSHWGGECFVFDDRVSVKQDLSVGNYDMCHGCRMPITEDDKKSSKYIRGVSCPDCFDQTTQEQKSRYMSRQNQIDLAKKRNQKHIGPKEEVLN